MPGGNTYFNMPSQSAFDVVKKRIIFIDYGSCSTEIKCDNFGKAQILQRAKNTKQQNIDN